MEESLRLNSLGQEMTTEECRGVRAFLQSQIYDRYLFYDIIQGILIIRLILVSITRPLVMTSLISAPGQRQTTDSATINAGETHKQPVMAI